MDIKEKIQKVLNFLAFGEKVSKNEMTPQDWSKLDQAFTKEYGISLQAAIEQSKQTPEGEQITPETQADILNLVKGVCDTAGVQAPQIDMSSFDTVVEGLQKILQTTTSKMQEQINTLSKEPESNTPIARLGISSMNDLPRLLGHTPHTSAYLFGIENSYFARGTWWNELVVTGQERKDAYRSEDATAFREAFNNYKIDFQARCIELAQNNQIGLLDYGKMVRGESFIDYSAMNSKLGEYVVRRMDAIIAYLRTLKSVADIFPVVSNVQNEMKAPTAHFGELSQSYLSGHNFKGGMNFDGEIYHVVDVMMKFAFLDPKQLEKEYIGYKNREGSNPMKWQFFEWVIVHFGTILFNEQQRRRVIGVETPRQGDFPQPAMLAADGVLRAIERVEEEYKVLPFDDLKAYDESTILDYVRTFWAKVVAILPNMQGMKLYINEKHQLWYIDAYDAKYGKNTDYSGPKNDIRYFSPESIVWVPNMDMTDYKMWIATPGNVENYEDKPNEMYALYFQQDLEILIMASWWKEGSGVLAPGVAFKTKAELIASKRVYQNIFTNSAVSELIDGQTSINGLDNTVFQTSANAAATVLTTITDFSRERVYKIICGSITNATTITKTGIFSEISDNFVPKAVGDYIKVYAQLREVVRVIGGKSIKIVEPTGKLLELERKVTV